MIRTRDFLLFVGVLLFLSAGIVFTLIKDTLLEDRHSPESVVSSDESPLFLASAPLTTSDRDGTIARLRALLEKDTTVITTNPSVEEVEGAENDREVSTSTDLDGQQQFAVDRCGGLDDSLSLAKNWPITETTLTIKDGRRVVLYTPREAEAPVDVNASSTDAGSSAAPSVLLSIPLAPVVSGEPMCVSSDVVGITTYGALIFNTDVSMYRLHTPEMLIGYAKDGFPIYGSYQGELDRCGGYQHAAGYRYSISSERNYIIGCYQSSPAPFIGL